MQSTNFVPRALRCFWVKYPLKLNVRVSICTLNWVSILKAKSSFEVLQLTVQVTQLLLNNRCCCCMSLRVCGLRRSL